MRWLIKFKSVRQYVPSEPATLPAIGMTNEEAENAATGDKASSKQANSVVFMQINVGPQKLGIEGKK